jgi:hypothetical protein
VRRWNVQVVKEMASVADAMELAKSWVCWRIMNVVDVTGLVSALHAKVPVMSR